MLFPAIRSPLLLLLLLALVHGVVDAFALFVQPLWPDLQHRLSLGDGAIQGTFFAWNLATSIPQLLFGYWGDRYRAHWLVWGGPAVAIACISSVGLVDSFLALSMLLVVAGGLRKPMMAGRNARRTVFAQSGHLKFGRLRAIRPGLPTR